MIIRCNFHGCCHAFLKEYPFEGGELAFVDPPYLKSTRKAPERYRYRYDDEEQDHLELLAIVKSLPCSVMLCGYRSALYDQWLSEHILILFRLHLGRRKAGITKNLPEAIARVRVIMAHCGGFFTGCRAAEYDIKPKLENVWKFIIFIHPLFQCEVQHPVSRWL